jgi:hypothetical protein
MEISQKIKEVLEKLFILFQEKRSLIPLNITDEQIINNENFKLCYLINILINKISNDEIFYTVVETILENNDYNIESLFSNFNLKFNPISKIFELKILNSDVVE